MPFRDHWNRMVGKSASSAGATPSSGSSWYPAFPALSSSAPASPTGGVTVASYTWPTSSSKSSSNTSPQQQHHRQMVTFSSPPPLPPSQQQQQQQQQQHKSKTKRRSKKSSSCHCSAARVHPSERPLTDENLRHQEMFANYTLRFGRSGSGSSSTSSSSSGRYSFDGEISPCSSRRGSLVDSRSAAPFA